MVEGFIVDHSYAARVVSTWVEGQPEYTFFLENAIVEKKTQLKVRAFRCPNCGLLQLYA
jgi:hypothetical protein